jgi:hypothetical protein
MRLRKRIIVDLILIIIVLAVLFVILNFYTSNPHSGEPMTEAICGTNGGKWIPRIGIPGLEQGAIKDYCLCPEKKLIRTIPESIIDEGTYQKCR